MNGSKFSRNLKVQFKAEIKKKRRSTLTFVQKSSECMSKGAQINTHDKVMVPWHDVSGIPNRN